MSCAEDSKNMYAQSSVLETLASVLPPELNFAYSFENQYEFLLLGQLVGKVTGCLSYKFPNCSMKSVCAPCNAECWLLFSR